MSNYPKHLVTIQMTPEQAARASRAVALLDISDPVEDNETDPTDNLLYLSGMFADAETGMLNGFTL